MNPETLIVAADDKTFDWTGCLPFYKMNRLIEKIGKLSNAAKKCKIELPTLEVIDTFLVRTTTPAIEGFRPGGVWDTTWVRVEVKGDAPVIPGYKFIAKVEHHETGNLIVKPEGVEEVSIPESYRTASHSWCDHCKKSRNRNETFILQPSTGGDMLRVGRQCLRDFLGHHAPETLIDIVNAWEAARREGETDDDSYWGEGGRPSRISAVSFISWVVSCSRTFGFVTSKEAYNTGNTSTAVQADDLMNRISWKGASAKEIAAKPTEADVEYAKMVCAWWNTQSEEFRTKGDYMWNLHIAMPVAADGYVMMLSDKIGLVASLVNCYRREMEFQAKAKTEGVSTQFLGAAGDKITVTGTLIEAKEIATDFGCSTHLVVKTAEGTLADWWASNAPRIEVGASVSMTGKIKKTSEFRGNHYTTIARAKMVVVGA